MNLKNKLNMQQISRSYFDPRINNNNMLHPGLYKYINNPSVRSLIREYDNEKYLLRKANRDKRKKGAKKSKSNDAWGDLPNRLHINKCFFGALY